MPKTPAYRKRKGYTQAIVTLTDSATSKRRDYWLGEHGSPASRELYHRLVAEWEAGGRRLPEALRDTGRRADARQAGPTVAELVLAYWRWAQRNLRLKRASSVRVTLRLLRQFDGSTAASQFGPRRLQNLREAMMHGDATADPPRKPWSRKTINDRVRVVIAVFRWAAAQELIPASVAQSLAMVAPLRRGVSRAGEGRRIEPVTETLLATSMAQMTRPVRALVELQLLTGARPGELVGLHGQDIDRTRQPWCARLHDHKSAYRGHARIVYFGPKAQAVLAAFLVGRRADEPLFSPAESEAERREAAHARRRIPLGYGNGPGTNKVVNPERRPGQRFTVDSYRRSIKRACDRAFPPPKHLARRVLERGRVETHAQWTARLTPAQKSELREWRKRHRWHPHQLRHTAATNIRREFGLEAAQLVLGHASAAITDAVYAMRDEQRVMEVILKCG